MMKQGLTMVVVLGLALAGSSGLAGAAECVNPGGTGGCFDSIQDAVDAANPGEKINVNQGT